MIGVGGHCLPKDGILLWWRRIESGFDTSNSLIINSRVINDESPAETIKLFERNFGTIDGKKVTILGTAYRFNSEDTRNSPSIQLALQLLAKECKVILHDPFVKIDDQNLDKFQVTDIFTNNLEEAVSEAEYIIMGTAHKAYLDDFQKIIEQADHLKAILDGCNIYQPERFSNSQISYTGIGRGKIKPSDEFIDFVYASFQIMETGIANEVQAICNFLNENYASSEFNMVQFSEVQRLAKSCSTGCEITDTANISHLPEYKGLVFRLVKNAFDIEHP